MTDDKQNGPALLEYIEKRLELMEKNFAEKLEVNRQEREAYRNILAERFKHVQEIFTLAQASHERAVDKQEIAQAAHNVSMNEWHKTVNELMSISISRPEFERWVTEFSNYRLNATSTASATQGERRGVKETKEATLSQLAAVSAAIGTIAALAASFVFRSPAIVQQPSPQAPQVVVVPAAPVPVQPTSPPATR